jgi:hypothetical protein
MDFTQRKVDNTLVKVFKKENYDRFKNEFTSKIPISVYIGNTTKKHLIRVEEAIDKKETIKTIKGEMTANDSAMKLWIIKVIKLYYLTLKTSDFINEGSYLYFVLAPTLKNLINQPRNILVFGEANLKAKAIEVNRYQDDDERSSAGPKIDIIIKDKKYDIEVMIVEFSGPPSKTNKTHFLEDRHKIAKNLKAIHKRIVSNMEVPNVMLSRKLKLHGLQVYNNNLIMYSLSKPCKYGYVFTQDFQFSIPSSSSILCQVLPTFIKNMFSI